MVSEIQADLEKLLSSAIKSEKAQKGTLQKYNPQTDELTLVAAEGFSQAFIRHFKSVKPFDSSCCGRAFGIGSTIVIGDVELEKSFLPHLALARSEGFRAIKSMPIHDENGTKLGVVSVHFAEPKWTWDMKKSDGLMPMLARILKEC